MSISSIRRWLGGMAVLALGLTSAQAFSLLGPFNEAYQVPTIAYNLAGDIGAPKNLEEEYRWNTPVVYYAFDESFLNYFRSNGVKAVEQAIAIFNDLTNHPYSTLNPADWPTEARRINQRAQALHLFDLKSTTLSLMLEELGLADPERYVWTLRNRRVQPGLNCPFMIYDVIKRSFDPFTFQPSSYVNGNLFSYLIIEFCSGPDPLAFTFNFPVDPTTHDTTPVASDIGVRYGTFYTGLTRDDVGALRYLYQPQNVNWEAPSANTVQFVTNSLGNQRAIQTSNLTLFAAQALTNDAVTLAALYPGLVVADTDTAIIGWTNIYATNISAVLSQEPFQPINMVNISFITNVTYVASIPLYRHTFANVVTFTNSPTGPVAIPMLQIPPATNRSFYTVQTSYLTNSPFDNVSALPHLVTNTTLPRLTNNVVGEFLILPTNACDIRILSALITNVYTYTNFVVSGSNNVVILTNALPGLTNLPNLTNSFFVQSVVDYSTSHVFQVLDVACLSSTNNATLRRGMDSMTFVHASYDSLVGRFFQPITNVYHLIEVTNALDGRGTVNVTNWFQRVVTGPDWLFDALDLLEVAALRTITAQNFRTNNETPGLAGPGNIEPNMTITFNKVGPNLINFYDPFLTLSGLSESTALFGTNFIWGWFDGSTNEPVIFPESVTIDDIETMLAFQILTGELPDATAGQPYAQALQATGGEQPYTWAPSPDSPPLPPSTTGLMTLTSDGILQGTPGAPGTYTFKVTLTEAGGRSTSRAVSLTINPP